MLRPRCCRILPALVALSLVLSGCDLPGFAPPAPTAAPASTPAGGTPGPVTLRYLSDPAGSAGLALDQQAAAEFERQRGIHVEFVPAPLSTTDRLAEA